MFEGARGRNAARAIPDRFLKKIGGVVKCFCRIPAELWPVVQITVPFEQIDGSQGRSALPILARENGNRAMFDPDSPLDLDQLRARLRARSDRMLAQWGASAAYMCTPEANFGAPPRQVFVVQLEEARDEWRRRHPKASPLGGNQAEG